MSAVRVSKFNFRISTWVLFDISRLKRVVFGVGGGPPPPGSVREIITWGNTRSRLVSRDYESSRPRRRRRRRSTSSDRVCFVNAADISTTQPLDHPPPGVQYRYMAPYSYGATVQHDAHPHRETLLFAISISNTF